MKIFEQGIWPEKINFVDSNNVLVGFDNTQQCCENFGWKILDHNKEEFKATPEQLEPYVFDASFFESVEDEDDYHVDRDALFKLTKPEDDNPIYLNLYNHHNGYYSHGFVMSQDETTIQYGRL